MLIHKVICFFSFLSLTLLALNNSPYRTYERFLNKTLNPELRYDALKKIQTRVTECKEFERDLEFYLRFGCFENYVLYTSPKNINVDFVKSYITDESFVIRSFALKVLVELQIKDLENVAWLVIEDPRNYYKGKPLGNVDTALKVMKKDKSLKEKLKMIKRQYPQISSLPSFQYLL